MDDFLKRGLIVVLICLIIYFIFFFVSVCLKIIFPKLNPSKCPQNYEISNCKDGEDDISCCKLKDTSNMGLDPSYNDYFNNLKENCDKEEIIFPSTNNHWNPNTFIDNVIKKELCKWSKNNSRDYGDLSLNEKRKKKKLNECFVPWDSITNGLDNNDKPFC